MSGDQIALLSVALAGVNVIVLIYSLLAACWSIRQTMKKTFRLWDQSEETLHRLKKVLDKVEGGTDRSMS